MNITNIVCKWCTLANVMAQPCAMVPIEVPQSSSILLVLTFPIEFPPPCSYVPIHTHIIFGKFPCTFPFTFPRRILVKMYMFCNFGTPKSPIMFNIMFPSLLQIGFLFTNAVHECCDQNYTCLFLDQNLVLLRIKQVAFFQEQGHPNLNTPISQYWVTI